MIPTGLSREEKPENFLQTVLQRFLQKSSNGFLQKFYRRFIQRILMEDHLFEFFFFSNSPINDPEISYAHI